MWRLAPLALLALAGCAPKNPYLGTWRSTVEVQGLAVDVLHRFGEQGAYSADLKTGDISGAIRGSYAYEQDQLTITPTDFSLDTSKAGILGKMAEQFRPEVEKEMKKPQAGKVAWTEKGFTVTPAATGVPPVSFEKVPQP